MTWTQPLCDDCWDKEHEDDPEHRSNRSKRGDVETCCMCGRLNMSGIYVRRDPATVPYPRDKNTVRWRSI